MAYQNTWGTFTTIAQQRATANKPQLKADKKTEQKIDNEIKLLQNETDALYNNDSLSDEELKILVRPIQDKINQLIDSKYETKEEIQKRLNKSR